MRSFAARSCEDEWMDAPDVSYEVFADLLGDLAKVNTVTLARPPTLQWLSRATRGLRPGDSFTLLDVGCGHGDMLRAIARWARKAGFEPELTGLDLSPWSAPTASAATHPADPITYVCGDVFDFAPEHPVDFIVSSLVAHHMPDDLLVDFVRLMEETAVRGWFVNDLHRHPLAFYGFRALSTVAGWHPWVRHDGQISVARAFSFADWRRLLADAGAPPHAVTLNWRFPFRICVGRIR